MKYDMSKEWCLMMADLEDGTEVCVGPRALEKHSEGVEAAENPHIAFSRFLNLMRRKKGWSLETLAERASVELGEMVDIEEARCAPEPRTVYQLSRVFGVPQNALLQLSGLTKLRDSALEHEAVRFAARSEPVEKLSKDESAALEQFIAVLVRQK